MSIAFIVVLMLIAGLAGGILSGLIGIGGGLIFVPLFDLLFAAHGIEGDTLVKLTLANSFFAIFISGIITSYRQIRNANFYLKEIIHTAIPAVITGMAITYLISAFTWYSENMFKLIFLGMLIFTVIRTFVAKPKVSAEGAPFHSWKFVVTGLLTGIASGLSGLGGGVIMIPLFQQLAGMDMKKASSVSIGVIPVLLLPMLGVYLWQTPKAPITEFFHLGYLVPGYVLPLSIGILLGTGIGLKWSSKLSNKILQRIFVALIFVIIGKYLLSFFT